MKAQRVYRVFIYSLQQINGDQIHEGSSILTSLELILLERI